MTALAVLTGAAVAGIRHGAPFAAALRAVGHPGAAVDRLGVDGVCTVVGNALAWVVAAWLLLAVAVVVAAELPTPLGRAAGAISEAAVPITLRRVVTLVLGMGTVTATLGGIADASTTPANRVAAAGAVTGQAVDLDWDAGATPAPRPHDRSAAAASTIRVRPGDSLWAISGRRLAAGADDAEIDASWRQLYRANAEAIGPDPSLIHPGLTLRPPPATDR